MELKSESHFSLKRIFWLITGVSIWLGVVRLHSVYSFVALSIITVSAVWIAACECIFSIPVFRPFYLGFALVGGIGVVATFLPVITFAYIEPEQDPRVYLIATMPLAIAAGSLAHLLHAAYLKYRRRY